MQSAERRAPVRRVAGTPDLKRAGATVVVITHDERYLDELKLPARRLRMDEGRFVAEHLLESS